MALVAGATVLAALAGRSADWNVLGEIPELGAGVTPGIAIDPAGTTHVVFMHDASPIRS